MTRLEIAGRKKRADLSTVRHQASGICPRALSLNQRACSCCTTKMPGQKMPAAPISHYGAHTQKTTYASACTQTSVIHFATNIMRFMFHSPTTNDVQRGLFMACSLPIQSAHSTCEEADPVASCARGGLFSFPFNLQAFVVAVRCDAVDGRVANAQTVGGWARTVGRSLAVGCSRCHARRHAWATGHSIIKRSMPHAPPVRGLGVRVGLCNHESARNEKWSLAGQWIGQPVLCLGRTA